MKRSRQNKPVLDSLPLVLLSRDGFEFEPRSRRWKLSRDVYLNLEWIDELLCEPALNGALKTLLAYAESYSGWHTSNMANRLRVMCASATYETGTLSNISPSVLINYRATLNRTNEFHLGALGGFLRKWIAFRYAGIDPEVTSLLDSWRLKGNIKGLSIQIKCPYKGALSDLEYESLHQNLLSAFEVNDLSLNDFVLVILFMATGRRPSQLADLKGSDLIEAQSSDGLCEFVLNVPRRKQRGGGWRKEFKPVALTPEIGLAVRTLILENESRLQAFEPTMSLETRKQLPIFPDWQLAYNMVKESQISLHVHLLATETVHVKTRSLSNRLEDIISSLSIPSERTAAPLRVFPTRLRRTLATRAAREGHGSLIIAELLDHIDDQNARVYTENVPEHVDAINQAVARQLAPLAQAFAGILVDVESQAERGGDASSRVRTDNGSGAGTCGHYGFCGACAPVACYTCRHFQPWLDGAHHEVLDVLRSEHDRILRITQDPQMTAINNRTILAVTEVIQRCEARRAETLGLQFLG